MGAEAQAQTPQEQTEPTELEPIRPERKPNMAARAAEFVVSQTFRTASGALMIIPRAVSRFSTAPVMDGPKLLEAGVAPAAAADAALEEAVMSRPLSVEGDQLEKNARELVHAFREDLGSWMEAGEVVMHAETDDPETDDPYGVTVKTVSHDSGVTHETEAVIDVDKKKGGQARQHVAHVAIRAVEPTIGGLRAGRPAESTTYIEGAGIGSWSPDQTVRSARRAIDRGDITQIDLIQDMN